MSQGVSAKRFMRIRVERVGNDDRTGDQTIFFARISKREGANRQGISASTE